MNKFKTFLIAVVATFCLSQNSVAETKIVENKYVIDPSHTSVLWVANHFGFSDVSGKFTDISGNIVFNESNPKKSSVEVTIKMAELHTGLAKFDEHLKSKDFFDVVAFPTAKFISKKITITGKNKAKIEGDLTLLKTTKTVVLNAELNKSGINPITQKQTIGLKASTKIKRSDFGINYALPGVSDEVTLVIQTEANI